LHFLMVVLNIVFDGETGRVVDADITTEAEEDPGGFECEEARVRSVDKIIYVRLPYDFQVRDRSYAYRLRKLPYSTNTFNRSPVFEISSSAIFTTVLSSSLLIQSPNVICGSRINGRYFCRTIGSSSSSLMASERYEYSGSTSIPATHRMTDVLFKSPFTVVLGMMAMEW
jgi:hypothetical protein